MDEQAAGKNFENDIIRITEEVLSDGTVEALMRDKIVEGFRAAIDSSFSWGELRKAIEGRVKEVLVPYVERYDMGHYVVKLDEILSQIVEHTALVDNAKIVENFRRLMIEPPDKTMTLDQLFKSYCKFVAANVDTNDLEIDYDDGPSYESVTAIAEIVEDDDQFPTSHKYATLSLYVGDEKAQNFKVRLYRWDFMRDEGYRIKYDMTPSIPGLVNMNEFEALLCSLSRAGVMLTCDAHYRCEEVFPLAEPEPNYS